MVLSVEHRTIWSIDWSEHDGKPQSHLEALVMQNEAVTHVEHRAWRRDAANAFV